jgi:PAS domain S-box-containing protein
MSETERQAILSTFPLGNEEMVEQLDRLAALAARICHAPVGLVSLVEVDRQLFIGRSGTDLTETARDVAFCDLAMHEIDGMIVPDATKDPRFCDNPLVTGPPAIRLYASHPLRSLEGAPLGSVCVLDTVPREELSEAQNDGLRTLADAAMALLERWRIDDRRQREAAQSRSAINELEQRFELLADAMPQMVWSSLPNGATDYFNSGWSDFTGEPPEASFGDSWLRFLHADDLRPAAECWARSVTSGKPYEIEYRLRRHDGEHRWVLARGLPMHDEAGEIVRWLGTCTDIHEQKNAAERNELLTRELSHRIKNIFAVISGLTTLSMRKRPEIQELGRELQQRILALGRAHDFVRPHSERSRSHHLHTSLKGMLGSLLGAYQTPGDERILIIGEDVAIDDRSATPLALFFHELATNAAKYGALAASGGRVEIRIVTGDEIELDWSEHCGPPVVPATETGFGGDLIHMSITRQLGGTLDYDWRREGLRVKARIPLSAMAR